MTDGVVVVCEWDSNKSRFGSLGVTEHAPSTNYL